MLRQARVNESDCWASLRTHRRLCCGVVAARVDFVIVLATGACGNYGGDATRRLVRSEDLSHRLWRLDASVPRETRLLSEDVFGHVGDREPANLCNSWTPNWAPLSIASSLCPSGKLCSAVRQQTKFAAVEQNLNSFQSEQAFEVSPSPNSFLSDALSCGDRILVRGGRRWLSRTKACIHGGHREKYNRVS